MDRKTRALVNLVVFAPLTYFGLRGKEPPGALLVAAGAITLIGFVEDFRVVKDSAPKSSGDGAIEGVWIPASDKNKTTHRTRTKV